jgi:tetratricopeptide (TPR) repeat protein
MGSPLPDRLPHSELSLIASLHDDLRDDMMPEANEKDPKRYFAAREQKRVTEAMTPESVWELVPSLATTGTPAELSVEADVRQRAMAVYRKHYGRSVYDPSGMKLKADDLWACGRYGDAEELDRLTIEVAQAKLGPEHIYTLKLMGNLAATIFGQGRLEEAEKIESNVVEMMKESLGEYDEDVLQYMGNLSCTYRSQGKWQQAANLGKQVVWNALNALGEDHQDTLTHMLNLAKLYALQYHWAATRVLLTHVIDMRTKLFGSQHKQTLRALAVKARLLHEQGNWTEADELAGQISLARQSICQHLPLENLDSIEMHAYYLCGMGKFRESERIVRELIQTRTSLLSARHQDTLSSRQDLVAVLYFQGKFVEAEKIGTEVLGARREVLGSRHPDTLTSMSDLGCLHSLRMPLEVIEKEFSEVLLLRKAILGEEHPHTLRSQASIAWVYSQKGRYREAEAVLTQVQQQGERIPGFEKHPDSVEITFNIAEQLRKQGEPRKAEELYRKAYDLCRDRFGEEHPSTLTALSSLSNLLSSRGQYHEAETTLERTLMAIKNKSDSLTSYHLLILGAETYLREQQRKWDDATLLYLRLINQMRRLFGEPHPGTASTKMLLAQVRSSQHRILEAEILFFEALDEMGSALGSKHPRTLDCLSKLAELRVSQKRWEEAISLYSKILAVKKEIFGERDRQTMLATVDLARVYTRRKAFSEAERLFNIVFESRKLDLGPANPKTFDAVSSIAWLRTKQSKWNDGADLYKTVVEGRVKAQGDQHPDTLQAIMNLASVYVQLSNFFDAEDLYQRVLDARTSVLGESHPETLNTMRSIADLRYKQSRFTDMEQLLKHVLEGYKAIDSCSPDVVAVTVTLAELSRGQCKLYKAEREGEEAVSFGNTQLGGDHPDVREAKLSLGHTKYHIGKFSEAETLYGEVFDFESKFSGPESLRSLRVAHHQGCLLLRQKKFEEAGEILGRTLQGQRKLLGENDPTVLESMESLADAWRLMGKFSEAETLQCQVLAKRIVLFGDCSLLVGESLPRLAFIKVGQQKHIEAEALYESGIQMQRKFVAEPNYHLLWSLKNLACTKYRLRKSTES